MDKPKTIGQINGIWGVLFRINLALLPFLLLWAAWITSETFSNHAFRKAGDRFTTNDASQMEMRILGQMNELPPDDWRARIIGMETKWYAIDRRLDTIERTQERILTILERDE